MFLDDLQKMCDFFVMSKEKFLSVNKDETSIGYELTKDYYNINKKHFIERLEEKLNKLDNTTDYYLFYSKILNFEKERCKNGRTY